MIRLVEIRGYRGIRNLSWSPRSPFVCLIGAGDSCKTTILSAIELALTPRRYVPFEDTDFFEGATTAGFEVRVTLTDVPDELLSDQKYGYLIRGWSHDVGLRDEPQAGDATALTIRLSVDDQLDPTWAVVNDRDPDGRRISAVDRARFGVTRLGAHADTHLSWAPGSALGQLLSDREGVRAALLRVRRDAISQFRDAPVPALTKTATAAQDHAKNVGVAPRSQEGFRPHLDLRASDLGAGLLSLCDGPVPTRLAGTGTARLLALAIQRGANDGSVVLVDELELGLEPHRIRRLLAVLKSPPTSTPGEEVHVRPRLLALTTHSPVALSELEPDDLGIVLRSSNGEVSVTRPGEDLRPLLRENPEAFLAPRILVCEGKTEIGICRAVAEHWASAKGSLAYAGVALAHGGGRTKGPSSALQLRALGYSVAFFGDSDQPLEPTADELLAKGVPPILWSGSTATEGRLALDLPWLGLLEMLEVARLEKGSQSVRDGIRAGLLTAGLSTASALPEDPANWNALGFPDETLRTTIGAVAHTKSWFKRVDLGQALGEIVVRHLPAMVTKKTSETLCLLSKWLYEGG